MRWTSRGTALKKLADAAGPLYKSLDDGQKHRFMVLARLGGRQFGHGHHGWRGRRAGAVRVAGASPAVGTGPGAGARSGAAISRPDEKRAAARYPRRVPPPPKPPGPTRRLFRCFPPLGTGAEAGQRQPPLLRHLRLAASAAVVTRAHSSVGRAADSLISGSKVRALSAPPPQSFQTIVLMAGPKGAAGRLRGGAGLSSNDKGWPKAAPDRYHS